MMLRAVKQFLKTIDDVSSIISIVGQSIPNFISTVPIANAGIDLRIPSLNLV